MITRLIWTIGLGCPLSPERPLNLILLTHSLTLCCWSAPSVDQSSRLLLIWDALTIMWCPCNVQIPMLLVGVWFSKPAFQNVRSGFHLMKSVWNLSSTRSIVIMRSHLICPRRCDKTTGQLATHTFWIVWSFGVCWKQKNGWFDSGINFEIGSVFT